MWRGDRCNAGVPAPWVDWRRGVLPLLRELTTEARRPWRGSMRGVSRLTQGFAPWANHPLPLQGRRVSGRTGGDSGRVVPPKKLVETSESLGPFCAGFLSRADAAQEGIPASVGARKDSRTSIFSHQRCARFNLTSASARVRLPSLWLINQGREFNE